MTGELKGIHVLVMLLGFFGITVAVNVALSIYAVRTFSGEDVSTPYLRGLAYNTTLRARAAQEALGWTITVDASRGAAGRVRLSVHVADRGGVPQDSLNVSAKLRRPTNAAMDRAVVLEDEGQGAYGLELPALAAGQWDVVVTTATKDGVAIEAERRLVLR